MIHLSKPKTLVLLGLILIASFLIRFISLSDLPNGLYWDEMDTGYQAYSLLKTGRDYFAHPLPLFVQSFADFRTPIFVYSAVPIIKALGLNSYSVRLVSLIWGILAVPLIFIVSRRLLPAHKYSGYFAAILIGLSIWHVHYSRISFEAISLVTLILAAICLSLISLSKHKYLPIAAFIAGLAPYSYSTGKLFLVFSVMTFVIIFRKSLASITTRKKVLSLIILLVVTAPCYYDSLFGKSSMRFHDLAIWTDPTLGSETDYLRQQSYISYRSGEGIGVTPRILDRVLYNKPILVLDKFIKNYFSAFSTEFLFLTGDKELRHSPGINSIGQLYIPEIVILIAGLIVIFSSKNPKARFLLIWLFLAPIASALTRDGAGHATRLIVLLPALLIICTLGFFSLSNKTRVAFIAFYIIAIFQSFGNYFTLYRIDSTAPFQWGYSDMVNKAISYSKEYDKVILDFHNDSALMAYLFTTAYSPSQLHKMLPLTPEKLTPELSGQKFANNIYLLPPGSRTWSRIDLKGKILIISRADQPLLDIYSPKIESIYYPNKVNAFYIFKRS